MKTAIIHDWLNGMRGGEKVLEALLDLYPDAVIYTLFYEPGKVSPKIAQRSIVTSWLNRVPGIYRHYRKFLPLFPAAVESFDLRSFDVVISSSHAVAKGAKAPNGIHVSYCHTPMRYLWDPETGYQMALHERFALSAIRGRLQRWDKQSCPRVDRFVANSEFVRSRIRSYYARDATVIYPPVDVRFYSPSSDAIRAEFFLAAGALVSYKRFDVVIEACRRLGRRLVIAGDGPDFRRLRRLAGPNVEFQGWVSDTDLRTLYRSARAFLFAAREDFGIMPVEAQACGCPVVAFASGGALETLREGESGVFFDRQEPDAMANAIRRLEERDWPAAGVRSQVERFSYERFTSEFGRFVQETPRDATSRRFSEIASLGRRNDGGDQKTL